MSFPSDQTIARAVSSAAASERYTSPIYSLIPSMVRSRISTLNLIRQSAQEVVSKPSLSSRAASPVQSVPPTTSSTPGRNANVSSASPLYSAPTSGTSSPRPLNPEHRDHALIAAQKVDVMSSSSDISVGGVDWVVADAGVRLWLNARGKAESGTRDPSLLRSMHIDALKYMSMALPSDLSSREVETIKAALPAPILMHNDDCSAMVSTSRPNLLRQGIAQAVCWIVALIIIIIPLVVTAIDRLLVYEREHRITQRVLDSSANVTRALGERGLDLGDAFIRFRGTPMGKAWLDLITWTVEGVAGGLNDGLVRSTQSRTKLLE